MKHPNFQVGDWVKLTTAGYKQLQRTSYCPEYIKQIRVDEFQLTKRVWFPLFHMIGSDRKEYFFDVNLFRKIKGPVVIE